VALIRTWRRRHEKPEDPGHRVLTGVSPPARQGGGQ
jgi:hypothetical protein